MREQNLNTSKSKGSMRFFMSTHRCQHGVSFAQSTCVKHGLMWTVFHCKTPLTASRTLWKNSVIQQQLLIQHAQSLFPVVGDVVAIRREMIIFDVESCG